MYWLRVLPSFFKDVIMISFVPFLTAKRSLNCTAAGVRMLLLLIGIASCLQNVRAQTTVQIGSGSLAPTTSLIFPINRVSATTTADYSRGNVLYTADELAGVGIQPGATITKLSWYKVNDGATVATASPIVFELWMRNSTTAPPLSTATTWTSITSTHTQVYNNTAQVIPATIGWIEFTLNTPFVYKGGNLEIASHWDISAVAVTSPTTAQFQWQYEAGKDPYAIGNNGSASAPTTLSSTSSIFKQRPNILITYTSTACTAPPVAGTAVASVTSTCPGVPFDLSLNGASMGDGQIYQWQQSSNNVNWTNIFGATNAISSVSQSTDQYYRAVVTCGGQSRMTTNTLLVTTTGPLSGTVTIDPVPPTAGTNFKTFTELAARLNCAGISGPVIVNVAAGSHTGRFAIANVQGVNATNTITINGNNATLVYSPTVAADRAAFSIDRVPYVTVDHLIINVSAGTVGWGAHAFNGSDNFTFTNNTIINDVSVSTTLMNFVGVGITSSLTSITSSAGDGANANNVVISNNTITGGGISIIVIGSNDASGTGNVISNNVLTNMYQYGIYLEDQDGAQVLNNNISRPTRDVTVFLNGIELGGTASTATPPSSSKNNLIKNNRIHDSNPLPNTSAASITGITISSADAPAGSENVVVNNLIYNFHPSTGTVTGISNSGADGMHAFHNTIVFNATNSASGDVRAINQSTLATNVNIQNNILYVTRSGTGTKRLLNYSTNTSSIISNYNVLYMNAPAGTNYIGTFGTNNQATLAGWQGLSFDVNSITDNPVFANTPGNNFTPTNNPVDGLAMGTSPVGNTPVANDINGNTRDVVHPDPGAIEWSAVANDAALTAFVPPAQIPYCANTLPVAFTLTNSGTDVLNSATINWTVNGVAQPVVTPSGLGLSPGTSANITLGTIPVTLNTFYNFAATVSAPNGVLDGNSSNNSFTYLKWRSALSGNYTVNKTAASSPLNFQSLKNATDTLKLYGMCGSIVIDVATGTGPHVGKVTIDSIAGTGEGSSIVINGNGNAVQYNATSTTNRSDFSTILLRSVKYVTIRGLVIEGLNASGACGINIINGASNIIIDSCTINIPLAATSGSSASGISTAGNSNYLMGTLPVSSNLTISNTTINGGGIFMVGDFAVSSRHSNISLLNNKIYNAPTDFITLLGLQDVVLRGNDIASLNRSPNGTIYCINVWPGVHGFVIDKNKIHDIPGTSGIYAGIYLGGGTYGTSGTVSNNLMYNWTNTGYQRGIYNGSADAINIYHNTIVLNDTTYTGTQTTHAYHWALSSAANATQQVKNNIFYINRGGTGTKTLIEVSSAANAGRMESNYNVFWFGDSAKGTLRYGQMGGSFTTFAGWQGTGQDINSVNEPPFFTDPLNGNFKPTNPLINGATMNTSVVGGIDRDILGVARTSNPDPGAYEFWTTVYTFTGNGNWNNAANWLNNAMPPSPLPAESEVVVNPSGIAVLNVPFTVNPNARISVKAGKQLMVQGNLTIQ
jgi:parallel beta-helix repeat protein